MDNLTLEQLIQSGFTHSWIDTNDLSKGIVFYDPEGNVLWAMGEGAYDLERIISGEVSIGEYAQSLYQEHVESNGLWNGEEYVQLGEDDNWVDVWNASYTSPQDAFEQAEEDSTFSRTGFEYGTKDITPQEYKSAPEGSDWTNITFKQYLDNQYGSQDISGAILSTGDESELFQFFGYKGDAPQRQLLNLGMTSVADENLKKAMFREVLSQKGGSPLTESEIQFFSDLGAPEFESKLNLKKQQRETRISDVARGLERTEDDIEKAEQDIASKMGDLPSRLDDALIGGDIAFARAGASELGYGGATEAREGLSEQTQETFELESEELRKALDDLGIAKTRAGEDFESQIEQLDQTLQGGLFDITSGISAEVGGAQSLVDNYIRGVTNPFSQFSEQLGAGDGKLDAQKKVVENYRTWT